MQTVWWSMQGPIGFFSILKISSNLPLYTFLYTIKKWLGRCILDEITQLKNFKFSSTSVSFNANESLSVLHIVL